MNDGVWMAALLLAGWAGWLDGRTRRIPNWLTVPALVVGVCGNTALAGWQGTKLALAGVGVGLGLLLPFVWLRGLGAADGKLMGALGALVGPKQILGVLLAAIFITGVMAVVEVTRQKRWLSTLRNLWEVILFSVFFGVRPHPAIQLENPGLLTLPFGVAVALGTLVCFGARWLGGSF